MDKFTRRGFLKAAGAGAAAVTVPGLARLLGAAASSGGKPNFIIFFTDDQGYQDIGCFGSGNYGSAPLQPPAISTPNLDTMATQGVKFTDFYVTAPVCSASRAGLMVGCYNRRVSVNGAFYPDSNPSHPQYDPTYGKDGLHTDEITMAELLKPLGYATACVGKWHLGHHTSFLPTRQGFDYYFGIPYSNDTYPGGGSSWHTQFPPLPVMENETKVETNPDQGDLTYRYTQKAYQFIRNNKAGPFFLYLPYTMPHWKVFSSNRYRNKSSRSYSDVIMEIDWSVGVILKALQDFGIDNNTLVIFLSDNGPWLMREYDQRGCALPLREGKWSVYEGGMRTPCIMRWPGTIPANKVCGEVASAMDLLPSLALLAGTTAPTDRTIDGKDIRTLMTDPDNATSPHTYYFMEADTVRSGKWKLHLARASEREYVWNGSAYVPVTSAKPLRLFDLSTNISENDGQNLAGANPGVVTTLTDAINTYNADIAANARPIGYDTNP